MAWEAWGKQADVMYYFDQESHYTSSKFRELLFLQVIKQSRSRRGNCWYHSPME